MCSVVHADKTLKYKTIHGFSKIGNSCNFKLTCYCVCIHTSVYVHAHIFMMCVCHSACMWMWEDSSVAWIQVSGSGWQVPVPTEPSYRPRKIYMAENWDTEELSGPSGAWGTSTWAIHWLLRVSGGERQPSWTCIAFLSPQRETAPCLHRTLSRKQVHRRVHSVGPCTV